MHVVVRKTSFMNCLNQAKGIIEKKNTVPILANLLIDATDTVTNQIKTTATDLEVSLVKKTPAVEITTPGKITVNFTKLNEIVSALSSDAEITLKADAKGGRLTITSGRSHFELATLPVEDYPGVDIAELPTQFSLDTHLLQSLISRTSFAMSTEETRYYLNGIYFHVCHDQHLYAVATDGHRLSRMRTQIPQGAESMPSVIVSRKTVNILQSLLGAELKESCDSTKDNKTSSEAQEQVKLHVSDTQIIFELPGGYLISRLVDGSFPDYKKVIPQDNDKKFCVNPGELSEVVKRVATMCTDRTPGIKVSIETGQLIFAAESNDVGSADELVFVDYEDQNMKIGFNHHYITEIANDIHASYRKKGVDTVDACFTFKDESSPVLVQAVNDDDVLHVLMPMRI